MNPQEPTTGAADTFPCQKCGAALQWDATKQGMSCPYCGFVQKMPTRAGQAGGQVREIPIEEGYRLAARGYGAPVQAINCKDCGATVNVGEGERTTKCAFCGSQAVLSVQADASAIRPESLVPFLVDRNAATDRFAKWIRGLWFRPNKLRTLARIEEMIGVYVPFWTFDAHIDSQWQAEAGYYYYVTETYRDSEGNTQTREVQHIRWEPAWGQRSDDYDDVLICASKGLPRYLVERLATFNTQQLIQYAPSYLAGWRAESYAIDLQGGHGMAREKMNDSQYARCGRDVPGDTHRNLNVNSHFSRETFKHILLPIWISAYKYSKKTYRFLVNGQSGEVSGEAPYSFWKIFLFSLLCLAIIGGIGYGVYAYKQSQESHSSPSSSPTSEPTHHGRR